MKRLLYVFIVIALGMIGWGSALARSPQTTSISETPENAKRVIAKGVGAIIGGDLAKAEDDAIANALKNAVEQTVGTMIQSDVLVKNYQVLESNIYSRTAGYIQSYRVLSKNEIGNNILEVTIEAVVKTGNLKDDLAALGIILQRKNYPRLMVLVDESNIDTHLPLGEVNLNTTETEIINTLQPRGFQFVDKAVVLQKAQRDALQAALEGDQAAAARIANSTGAEVLIVGKAISKAATNVPAVLKNAGLTSCQATINLRAIRGDDGNIIATVTKQAAAAHIDPIAGGTQALQKAAHLAAIALAEQIVEQWRKDIYSGATVQMRVLNIPSYVDLMHLKNWLLSTIRGVKSVSQREFSGGTALLDIQGTLNSEKLAGEISLKSQQSNGDFHLEILNVTANALVVKMVKKTTGEQ